jgi:hypothetical protein
MTAKTSAAGAHSPEGQRVSDGHEAARQDDPKKSGETKGAQPEPAKVQRIYFHRIGSPHMEDTMDIPLGDDPKRHVADVLIHRVLVVPGAEPVSARPPYAESHLACLQDRPVEPGPTRIAKVGAVSARPALDVCKHGWDKRMACCECNAESAALQRVSARPASEPTPPDWRHVETLIDEAVEGYVMEGDSGCYTPTEHERVLIKDCIMGLTADREFLDALRPSFPVQAEAPQITGGWTSGTVQGSK